MTPCDFTDNGECAAKIEVACICSQPAYQLAKKIHQEEQRRVLDRTSADGVLEDGK